jgi:hypothetical protein
MHRRHHDDNPNDAEHYPASDGHSGCKPISSVYLQDHAPLPGEGLAHFR